ncbi:MAG: hypothetical protein AB8G11_10290 [Saprospiraceae bacterium]
MLVQHFYPLVLSSVTLDDYLARGWFRSSLSMYRARILCFEQELHEVINIRLPLKNYIPKKRLRRIKRRVKERFEIVVQPFENTPAKEVLYENHKHRFRGYLQKNLDYYLKGEDKDRHHLSIFNTYEVSVYDKEKLIGFSLFDLGQSTIASIICVFDADYSQYSIGTFTMLQEIEYAKSLGFQYYYPGYVLHNTTIFDYKLRLGNMEFYNQHKEWRPINELHTLERISDLIQSKLTAAENFVKAFDIDYVKVNYAAFPFAYFEFDTIYFVRTPIFLLLFEKEVSNNVLILEYWQEQDEYVISQIEIHLSLQHFGQLQMSEEARRSPSNCLDLLAYNWIISQDSDITNLFTTFVRHLQDME